MAAPSLTLKYFDIHGLAARIRIACAVGGIALRDHRFADRAEFTALKASGELPFGQVPCLFIEKDGRTTKLAQSSAILRYVCQLGGLYPADPIAAGAVEASLAAEADAFASFTAVSYPARNGLDHLDAAAIEKAFENQRAEVIVSESRPRGPARPPAHFLSLTRTYTHAPHTTCSRATLAIWSARLRAAPRGGCAPPPPPLQRISLGARISTTCAQAQWANWAQRRWRPSPASTPFWTNFPRCRR